MRMFVAVVALIAVAAGSAFAGGTAGPANTPNERDDYRWDVTGPFGGSVRSLAIAPDDALRVYIGTSDGQLYRSRDGGRTWSRTIPGFSRPGLVLDNLIIDPSDPQVMYLGVWSTDDRKQGGVFKSTDGGDTWFELKDLRDESVRALTIAPNDANVLVAGTLSGVFESVDAGKTWERISPLYHADILNVESVAIDPRDPSVIYAGTTHLAWKTIDGGASWTSIKQGMLDDSDVFSIAVIADQPDRIFASACSGIYKSDNAGELWSKVQGIPFSSRRTHIILPHPTKPDVVFAGTTQGLWRTMDGGKSWQLITTKTLVVNSVDIHPSDPDTVLLGTDEHGVLVSRDLGQSFVESNVGFIHRHILAVQPDVTMPNRVYSTVYHDGVAGGFFISTDGGRSWRQSIKGLGGRDVFTLYQDPDQPTTLWAGTNYGIYRSADRGENWAFVGKTGKKTPAKKSTRRGSRAATARGASRYETRAVAYVKTGASKTSKTSAKPSAADQRKKSKGKPKSTPSASRPKKPTGSQLVTIEDQVNDFARYTDGEGQTWMLAVTTRGLFRSKNPDAGWEAVQTPGLLAPFSAVSSDPNDPERIIYLGTSRGLALTYDFGVTWERVNRGPDEDPVKSIAQDPRDPKVIYVGARGALYKTKDGGRSWRKRGGGLPAGDITIVTIDPINPDVVYAADYRVGGVYRSRNQGEDWDRLDSGLPSERVWTIAADPFDPNRVYAGSYSGGVYVLTISPSSTLGSSE